MEQLSLPFYETPEVRASKLLNEQKKYCGTTRLGYRHLVEAIREYPHLKWFVYKGEKRTWKKDSRKGVHTFCGTPDDSYIVNEEGWW